MLFSTVIAPIYIPTNIAGRYLYSLACICRFFDDDGRSDNVRWYLIVILISDGYGASLVAQLVKNLPAMRKTWVWSLGWEDPLEKGKAAHSSILAWRIPWTTVHGVTESDMTEGLSLHFQEAHGKMLALLANQCSCITPVSSSVVKWSCLCGSVSAFPLLVRIPVILDWRSILFISTNYICKDPYFQICSHSKVLWVRF